ncbi:MAG: Lon protease-like protein [Janthinobacterium sp.]|jgi:Lon protease-like protein
MAFMPLWGMKTIPLFPLNTVFYPDGQLPLQVFEVRYLEMARKCIADDVPFGIVSLLHGTEVRKPEQQEALAAVGTMARIATWSAPMPALLHLSCRGMQRFRIVASARLLNGLWMADIETMDADIVLPIPAEQQDAADALGALIRTLQERGTPLDQMPIEGPFRLDECGWVANRWCELLDIEPSQKQLLLEQQSPLLRLELVQDLLAERGWLE